MSTKTQCSTLLPPPYPERLACASRAKDHLEIDRITDELAKLYPGLVRRRKDGSKFGSLAAEAAFRV